MGRLADRVLMRQDREYTIKEPSPDALPVARPVASPAAVYLASLAPNSAATMRQALGVLAQILGSTDPLSCPWWALTYAHTSALRARLADRYAPATANKLLAALRRVLLEARRLDLMTADACARASDLTPIRGATTPRGRMLDPLELAALFRVCAGDRSARGRRDAALIAIGVAGGLRRAELAALDQADLGMGGLIRVRRGKGAKDRALYLAGDALRLAQVWAELRGTQGQALFIAISRTGRLLDDRRLTPAGIRTILLRRCDEAGLPPATPHDLRRTCISRLLDRGVDLATAARHAGHASVTTTARYDRRGERALQDAAAQIGDLQGAVEG